MTHGRVQQIQLVLQTELAELGACGRIHLCPFAAVGNIDLVHVFHKGNGLFFSNMLVQGPTEIVGDIIFPVGKRACPAEPAHDRAGFTVYAAFHLLPVNGAVPLLQRASRLKHGNF